MSAALESTPAPARHTYKWHVRGVWPAVPALLFLTAFFAVPLAILLASGFVTIERGVLQEDSFTFRYLTQTLSDDLFWKVWWRSFWVGVVSTLACLILGYPLAYAYTLCGRFWQTLLLVVTIAPLLTSALVRTYAWLVILGGRRGVVNAVLIELDLIERPLRMLNTDLAVILGMTQIHLPFMVLPLITVLSGRDRNLEQASLGLGASRVGTFFRITVPLSIPGISAGLALVFAISYTNFIIPQLLGGGNYTTLAVLVYEYIVVILDWSKGAMLALLLLSSCFVFVLAITLTANFATRWTEARR
ncbi:MAG: ABC transporter permease [Gammaproteobacteria bacterium]